MSWISTKVFDQGALKQFAFWKNYDTGEAAVNVQGIVQLANEDGETINPASGGTSAVGSNGSGNYTWSTKQGDFTATITNATKNITIAGLPWTFTWEHVAKIEKKTSAGVVTVVDLNPIAVSGSVITLADEDNFVTGDLVSVTLVGPDKSYNESNDAMNVNVLNPNYAHYTSVETLINESNMGVAATADGGGGATSLIDADGAFDPDTIAEGFVAYQTTDADYATIIADTLHGLAGDGGVAATTITTTTLTGASVWTSKAYTLPEVKRFVIPAEGYSFMTIDALLDSQDGNNSCYAKIYATLDANADDTDDTYWKDVSLDVFGAAMLTADGIGTAARAVSQGVYLVDSASGFLKYMIKIVAECEDATPDNEFDILIKKYS